MGTITACQRERECVAREPLSFRNRLLYRRAVVAP